MRLSRVRKFARSTSSGAWPSAAICCGPVIIERIACDSTMSAPVVGCTPSANT
jgi:hypothetical protein